MNKYFNAGSTNIYYKTRKYGTVTYAKMDPDDQAYLRYMYSMLYGHVKEYKTSTQTQRLLYNHFFNNVQKSLPKPSKNSGIGKYNTWATFLEGLEHNFNCTDTKDFSTKQIEHVEDIVNQAVDYFTIAHPDFEPTVQAPNVKLIRI